MCFRVKKGFHLLATLNSSLNNHGEYIIGLAVLYGGQSLSKCTTRTMHVMEYIVVALDCPMAYDLIIN